MNIAVGIYALLLLIGGVVGHYTAGSLASLISGSAFALVFGILAFQKGKAVNYITIGLTLVLLGFFGYRYYFLGFKFMPAGLMILLSLLLLVKLGLDCLSIGCCRSDRDKYCTPSDHKKP